MDYWVLLFWVVCVAAPPVHSVALPDEASCLALATQLSRSVPMGDDFDLPTYLRFGCQPAPEPRDHLEQPCPYG